MRAMKFLIGSAIMLTLAFALAFLSIFFAEPVHAAPQCDMRDNVLVLLADRYGEQPVAMGVAGQAAVMEMFANDATGTWSLTMTLPDGMMCLMASGTDYITMDSELPANL